MRTLTPYLSLMTFFPWGSVEWTLLSFFLVVPLVRGCCINILALSTVVHRILIYLHALFVSVPFLLLSITQLLLSLLLSFFLSVFIFPLTIATLIIAFSESPCELDGLISVEQFVIAGDFNVDFIICSWPNCSNPSAFMPSNNLVSVNQMYINYNYHKDDFSCFSSPDQILFSTHLQLITHWSCLRSRLSHNFLPPSFITLCFKFAGVLSIPFNLCAPRTLTLLLLYN